jgi:hypothetical protein
MMSCKQLSLITPSINPSTNATIKEACKRIAMAMNAILSGLVDFEKSKVGQCTSSKYLWDKIKYLHVKQGALDMLKYKGALFLFNCEQVGHLETKFPY